MDELLARLLVEAERRYGPRRPGYRLLPVRAEGANYPETIVIHAPLPVVSIRVTQSATKYPLQATYQLAHEAIHALVAVGRRDTHFFEEGLAGHHALTLPDLPETYRAESEKVYPDTLKEPLEAFRALNPTDVHIRTLRTLHPLLDDVTPQAVVDIFKVSSAVAEHVCRRLPVARPRVM